MAFHRLSVPAYFGGLPGGYDYINNALAGSPSFAGGIKASGPNVGTYFIGWGDSAGTEDANRPHKALAENCDALDDLFRRDLAVPQLTADVEAVGSVSSIVLPVGTFVGLPGTPNTQAGIATFVDVVDANDRDITVAATGAKVRVTSITGATPGDGFSTATVTLNLSPAIPTGTIYRVYYGARGNLATLPADALTFLGIRGIQEVSSDFLDFKKQISRSSGANVAALVGSVFETPDGVRLTKAATQAFDVDPDGTVGGTHSWTFRKGRDASAVTVVRFTDETITSLVGAVQLVSGAALQFLGTGLLRDANLLASTDTYLALTSATAAAGDQFFRVGERATTGTTATTSLAKLVNGRWTITVGDGVISFGDFSGADAVREALLYLSTSMTAIKAYRILVKPGAYILTTPTQLFVPSEYDVVIEGQARGLSSGSGFTRITSTTSAFAVVSLGANAKLTLKNLTIERSSGSSLLASGVIPSAAIYIDSCFINGLGIKLTDPTPYASERTVLRVENSRLKGPPTVGVPLIDLEFHNPLSAERNYLFQNSTLESGADDTPLVRIKAGSSGLILSHTGDFLFENCLCKLLSATLTGADMTGNCGLLEIDPNGSNLGASTGLLVDKVHYRNTDVWANHLGTGLVSCLLYLRIGADSTHAAALRVLHIEGGRWICPQVPTAFIPVYIGEYNTTATATHIERVILNNWVVGFSNDAGITAAAYSFGTGTAETWAGAVGSLTQSVGAVTIACSKLTSKNINFVGSLGLSNHGEFWFEGQYDLDVDGIFITILSAGTAGVAPYHRVKFSPALAFLPGARSVRNVSIYGGNLACVKESVANYCSGGILLRPNGKLVLDNCHVRNLGSSAAGGGSGFTLMLEGSTNAQAKGLTLRECIATNCDDSGFMAFQDNTGTSPTILENLRIVGGEFSSNGGGTTNLVGACGIFINAEPGAGNLLTPKHVVVEGTTCSANASRGIRMYFTAFGDAPNAVSTGFRVLNNTCIENCSTYAGPEIEIGQAGGAGSDPPICTVTGNHCSGSAARGCIGIRLPDNVAIPINDQSTSSMQNVDGLESGYTDGTGASQSDRIFYTAAILSNSTCLHNHAFLVNV